MKPAFFVKPIFATAIAVQLGCLADDPTAPNATEPFPVTIEGRIAAQAEVVPAIHGSGASGNVTIRVTRPGLCAPLITAALSRAPHRVDIVSHVSGNPGALCSRFVANFVIDYSGTVSSLPAGAYLIRVFEGEGDGTPRLIGSVTVSLPQT